jgi:hypothetical protein
MIESWNGIENEWSPFPEKYGYNVERCTGVETMQPFHYFDKNRLIYSMEINRNIMDMEDFCDSEFYMLKIDPRFVFTEPVADERQSHIYNILGEYENLPGYFDLWQLYYLKPRLELTS